MTTMEATQLDGQGLDELKLLNDAIRQHQVQVVDLLKRRKQLILRLRKQRITYKEISKTIGVSEQLIYKIIKDDIDRTPQYDAEGKLIRHRGRPPKPVL
jgi:DNA-directed RNA polymerase specialized sigma subunit